MLEEGEPDALFHNDGDGNSLPFRSPAAHFWTKWPASCANRPTIGVCQSCSATSMAMARRIFVCNDFHSPDRIWLNDGHGHFRAAPRLTLRHTSMFSMGVDFADVNRDGFDDFFVADMLSRSHRRRNTRLGNYAPQFLPSAKSKIVHNTHSIPLQLNRGDGTFTEIAHFGRSRSFGLVLDAGFSGCRY